MKACPKIWPLPEIDRAVTAAVIGYCKVGHSQEIATRPVYVLSKPIFTCQDSVRKCTAKTVCQDKGYQQNVTFEQPGL